MTLTDATRQNLLRKSGFIDEVHMIGDIPLFSWIDISLTELCNRVCSFCPRADPDFYPNQNLHASNAMIRRIADECPSSKHLGRLSLFRNRGSGPSWFDVKPLGVDGSSGVSGWSVS